MISPPITLTIAGSDCSSGAGLQADLKTFQHFGTYGLTVVTCVVAETPETVCSIHSIPTGNVCDQLALMLDNYPVTALKTGMLFSAAHVIAVSRILEQHPGIKVVVDPVMIASSGAALVEPDAVAAYLDHLLPLAALVTPNLDEAAIFHGSAVRSEAEMVAAAESLLKQAGTAVLVKGGHLVGAQCADVLVMKPGGRIWFRSPRIDSEASHGTGCTLSAAITARLAQGDSLAEAVGNAKAYLERSLAEGLTVGKLAHLNQATLFAGNS